MKSLLSKLGIVVFLVTMIGGCSKADLSSDDSFESLVFEMEIAREALSQGRVVLVSTLKNISERPVTFLPWNTPMDAHLLGNFLTIEEFLQSGQTAPLQYQGPVVKRAAPKNEDYLELAPSETTDNSLDLTNSYRFCANRQYQVNFTRDIVVQDSGLIRVKALTAQFLSGNQFPTC